MKAAAYLQNYGALNNAAQATLSLQLDTMAGGTVENHGIIQLVGSGTQSHLNETVDNREAARMSVLPGHSVFVSTSVINGGDLENAGRLYVLDGGLLNNTGGSFSNRIDDDQGWMIVEQGGTITADKQGEYRNEGELTFRTSFTLQASQVLHNSGTLAFSRNIPASQPSSSLLFQNHGLVVNTGELRVWAGQFENTGEM